MQDMAVHACRYVYVYHITAPRGVRFLNRYYVFYLFDVLGPYFVLFSFVLKLNLVHPTEWFTLLERTSVSIVIILHNVLGDREDSMVKQTISHQEIPPFRFQLLFCLFFSFFLFFLFSMKC